MGSPWRWCGEQGWDRAGVRGEGGKEKEGRRGSRDSKQETRSKKQERAEAILLSVHGCCLAVRGCGSTTAAVATDVVFCNGWGADVTVC